MNQITQCRQNKKNEVGENPLWFSKYSFNTLGEWITSALEKSLINKYLSIKKGNEKLTSPFEYGRTLMDFYQNMDATQKKKMLKTYPTECLLKHEIKMQCLFEIKINEIKMDDLDLIQNSIKKLEDIYYFTKQAEEQAKVKKNKSKKSPNKKIKEQLLQFQYETTTNQISQSDSNHSNLQNKELLIEQTRNSFEENQKKCQTQCLKESIDQNNKISEKILISQEKQNESIIMKQQQNLNNYLEIQQQNNKINNESQPLKTVLQDCIIQQQEQSVNTYNLNKNNKRKKKKKKNNTELFIDQVFQNYLNNKINDFADQISINSNKLLNSRIVVFQRIRYFMKKLYQDYFNIDAKLFGSNALGLALPSSDIDILLTGFQVATRVDTIYLLEKISFYLKKMRWIVNCETYTTARIPIIKLQINPNIKFFQMHDFMEGGNIFRAMNPNLEINEKVDFFIKVDITIQAILQEYSHRGCQSTQFMRNHMSQRCQINQLVLILKQILYSRGLHETYRGGISSYCIFLMIASYLKQNKNCKQQQQQNEKQLGTLIYDILKFYSLQFDNKNYGISYYQNKECYFEVDDINTPLYILDPIHSNLISGNCSKYPIILQQFRKIIDSLDNMKEIIRQDLKKLQYTELKRFMQKKKSIQKWLKRYDKNQNMSIEKIMG